MIYNKISRFFCFPCLLFLIFFISAQAETLTFKNEISGVELSGPDGWIMKPSENGSKNKGGFFVGFYQSSLKSGPRIMLSATQEVTQDLKTPLDYANFTLEVLKYDNNFRVIKEPTLFTINGREGVNYIFEFSSAGELKRLSEYVFMKDGLFYQISYTANVEDFDNNLNVFESCVKTLVFR